MTTTKVILAGVLMAATLAPPVLAAETACLQANRIWGWQAVDDRTLIVTDRQYNRYTVSLSGGCLNLSQYAGMPLIIRTKTSLGCVSRGDMIGFMAPAIGPVTCFVNDVKEGVPPPPAE